MSVSVRMCSHISVSDRVCSCVSVCGNLVPFHRGDFVKFCSYFTKSVLPTLFRLATFQRFTAMTLSILRTFLCLQTIIVVHFSYLLSRCANFVPFHKCPTFHSDDVINFMYC